MDETGYELDLDQDRNVLTVRYLGNLTLDTAKDAIRAAFANPGVTADTAVLIDATQVQIHEIDVEWFKRYQAFRDAEGYPSQITALYVSGDESHQLLGQLWAAIRATRSANTPGVFTDRSAAIEWLFERRRNPSSGTRRA